MSTEAVGRRGDAKVTVSRRAGERFVRDDALWSSVRPERKEHVNSTEIGPETARAPA
ncbi:hypothetical protein AS9A_3220 [Hoyosella subflava DQS3-9A1]|uniref:Uncharacterized protein n=1 Tax=Hoyosella subflava (strain DSM 45089 / JCM 17490 / NBRC 109087 / DQS3-9A1) TaxID=443218 RepID=F6ENJ6_HOYSD|nr:hypothetical protein AS9A_3220 [Hoyosella subflava DQS3-9A1]